PAERPGRVLPAAAPRVRRENAHAHGAAVATRLRPPNGIPGGGCSLGSARIVTLRRGVPGPPQRGEPARRLHARSRCGQLPWFPLRPPSALTLRPCRPW